MLAKRRDSLPPGDDWLFEPKWDGFRVLAFRDGDQVALQSKAGQPLTRYFPEVVAVLAALKPRQFILDGEIVIPIKGRLSFDDLLLRIHPAESRIQMLATEIPAQVFVFDLLYEPGRLLVDEPLRKRRARLERFFDASRRWSAKFNTTTTLREGSGTARSFCDGGPRSSPGNAPSIRSNRRGGGGV